MSYRISLIVGLSLMPLSVLHANWYAGVQLGANFVAVDKSLSYPLVSDSPITLANYQSGYTGFHGQLLSGYEFALNDNVGLAIEGNADWYTGHSNYTVNNWFMTLGSHAEEKLKYGFGLYALPEYYYNSTTRFFAGPGYSTAEFAVNSGFSGGNTGVTGQFKEWLPGFAFKAGVGTKLNEKMELLLSYQFNHFTSVSRSGVEPLSADSLTARYGPYSNSIMLGLQYFC